MHGTSVGIKVGTAIATLVKNGQLCKSSSIRYRDFEDTRAAERRNHLLASSQEEGSYVSVEPNPILGLPFKPRTVATVYLDWPRLPELFSFTFPGIKTSRDPLLVDIDRHRLSQRMDYYLDSRNSNEAVRLQIPISMTSASRFDAAETRRTLLQIEATALEQALNGNASATPEGVRRNRIDYRIQSYYYRPFDLRWLYWEPHTKLLDEKREDYFRAHVPGSLAMLSERAIVGPSTRRVSRARWRVFTLSSELLSPSLCAPIRPHSSTRTFPRKHSGKLQREISNLRRPRRPLLSCPQHDAYTALSVRKLRRAPR